MVSPNNAFAPMTRRQTAAAANATNVTEGDGNASLTTSTTSDVHRSLRTQVTTMAGRVATTLQSASNGKTTSRTQAIVFTDIENVILSFVVAQQEAVIANTAALGPVKEAKNRIWEYISQRLCQRGEDRTPDMVRTRWKSMRSSYSFKSSKARNLAEMYYKKIKGTPHHITFDDVTMPGIETPAWLLTIIKSDPFMRPQPMLKRLNGSTPAGPSSKKARSSHGGVVVNNCDKRPYLVDCDEHLQSMSSRSTPEADNSLSDGAAEETPVDMRDVLANRRRAEELHVARIELINAQRREIEARTRLTQLQVAHFQRQYLSDAPCSQHDSEVTSYAVGALRNFIDFMEE